MTNIILIYLNITLPENVEPIIKVYFGVLILSLTFLSILIQLIGSL